MEILHLKGICLEEVSLRSFLQYKKLLQKYIKQVVRPGFFDLDKFLKVFEGDYDLMAEFDAQDKGNFECMF